MDKLRINEKVMSKTLAGEEVLLDLVSGNYFGMNDVATFLWARIKQGAVTEDLVQALCATYALSHASAERDVGDFIETLRSERVLLA